MTDHLERAFKKAKEQARRNRRTARQAAANYTDQEFDAIIADIAFEGELERVHNTEPSQ